MKARGFSLIEVLASFVVLGIVAGVSLMMFTSRSVDEARLDRRVLSERILTNLGFQIQSATFEAALSFCSNPDRFAAAISSPCLTADKSALNPAPGGTYGAIPLDVRLDWKGDHSPSAGQVCASVTRCERRGANQILDLTLNVYWKGPTEAQPPLSSQLMIRKIR